MFNVTGTVLFLIARNDSFIKLRATRGVYDKQDFLLLIEVLSVQSNRVGLGIYGTLIIFRAC